MTKLILACTTAAILTTIPAHAALIVENFDGTLDSTRWSYALTGSGTTAALSGGRLRVALASNAAGGYFDGGLLPAFTLSGDFDVQVDYYLDSWPSHNGVRVGFILGDALFGATVHRVSAGPGDGFIPESYYSGAGAQLARVATNDQTGSLRMSRSGSTLSGYVLTAGSAQWTLLNTMTFIPDSIPFSLVAWSHDSVFGDARVDVSFDNLRVETAPVPEPSTLLLLACGGLRLLARRRR